jgi:copper chaperone CopZ
MNLMDLPGVTDAKVDHETGVAEVTYDQALVSEKQIIDAIQAAGYQATEA